MPLGGHFYTAANKAVNSSKLFWFHALLKGKFKRYPGVRLYGEIGPLRPASPEEIQQVESRIRALKWTKGSQLIWSSFHHVREIKISSYRWVEYSNMNK